MLLLPKSKPNAHTSAHTSADASTLRIAPCSVAPCSTTGAGPSRAAIAHLCMTLLLAIAITCTLPGCAHRPAAQPVAQLLDDSLFAPPSEPVDVASVFALSDAMRRYANASLRSPNQDLRQALIDAVSNHHKLQLRYDAGSTRNAAQAFDARAGNCLSLVIMTAAFARHLGLPVSYQNVVTDTAFTRAADLLLASGHVNVVLGKVPSRTSAIGQFRDELVVDFLPPSELRGQRAQPLGEATVLAMYLNNRAAENLVEGRLADSYAWARAAIQADPGFQAAVNTLAVVYLRAGHLPQAEATLRHALQAEPDNLSALANLQIVLRRAGRSAEAEAVALRLKALQPYPPFHFFELGRQAMAAGAFAQANDWFERELRSQPYQPEVHFWAAQAQWRLGQPERAAEHLRLAVENSATPGTHALYAAKLDRLRALRVQ